MTLNVPALRDRASDIPLLVKHFVQRVGQRIGSNVKRVHPRAVEMLQSLSWPGNVRQLHHEIQRAMIFADGPELTLASFRDLEAIPESLATANPAPAKAAGTTIKQTVGNMETALIREALQRYNGNKKRVAEELGISRSYLYKKLNETKPREQ